MRWNLVRWLAQMRHLILLLMQIHIIRCWSKIQDELWAEILRHAMCGLVVFCWWLYRNYLVGILDWLHIHTRTREILNGSRQIINAISTLYCHVLIRITASSIHWFCRGQVLNGRLLCMKRWWGKHMVNFLFIVQELKRADKLWCMRAFLGCILFWYVSLSHITEGSLGLALSLGTWFSLLMLA